MTGPSPSLESVWRQAALATLQGPPRRSADGRRYDRPSPTRRGPVSRLAADCARRPHQPAVRLPPPGHRARRRHMAPPPGRGMVRRTARHRRAAVLRATGEIGLGLAPTVIGPTAGARRRSTTWWPRASCCRRRCPSAPGWRSRAVTSTRRGRQSRTRSAPAPGPPTRRRRPRHGAGWSWRAPVPVTAAGGMRMVGFMFPE